MIPQFILQKKKQVRTQEVNTKKGTVEVIELNSCFAANILISIPVTEKTVDSELYALKQRFIMWFNSGTYDKKEWVRYSKTIEGYKITAFVKGKDVN